MKRQTLATGLLSLTVVSMMTGCVDDKYDLSDVDTTSRFTVDNLTVPVNLSEIKLENVINLDDNENISQIDGQYAIAKHGDIAPTQFNIGEVHVNSPSIAPTAITVGLGGLPFAPGTFIPGTFSPEPITIQPSDLVDYELSMRNVDKALKVLKGVKTKEPISVEVVLTLPSGLAGSINDLAFQNLQLQLPWGLVTDAAGYDRSTGILTVGELKAGANGKATLTIHATGLELGGKGKVEDGQLAVSGKVGILGGKIKLTMHDITLPASLDITADYQVSSFDLASFSGEIDYNMEAISINPISLSDLPDFLNSPDTKLFLANPQILVDLHNPVSTYNLMGAGCISLTSNFKNGISRVRTSDPFSLDEPDSRLAFCTGKEGYTFVGFDGLRNVLTSIAEGQDPAAYEGDGLPESIQVDIKNINFYGNVEDFPMGDLGSAQGNYEFIAPLGFGQYSKVIYETTESGWASEDLDHIYINKIHLDAKCSTDLPVGLVLKVTPVDRNGNEIAVKEDNRQFTVAPDSSNEDVSLTLEGLHGPITGFDGVKFTATVSQDADNTEALGPNLNIKLDDLRVTVDGYFEKEL